MAQTDKLYALIANYLNARANCEQSHNTEWFETHTQTLKTLIAELPHGSGLDARWDIDLEASNDSRIILVSAYHAMDENGYYDGWINFKVTVKPSLQFGISIDISGRFGKYQHVKDYLLETIEYALQSTITLDMLNGAIAVTVISHS